MKHLIPFVDLRLANQRHTEADIQDQDHAGVWSVKIFINPDPLQILFPEEGWLTCSFEGFQVIHNELEKRCLSVAILPKQADARVTVHVHLSGKRLGRQEIY